MKEVLPGISEIQLKVELNSYTNEEGKHITDGLDTEKAYAKLKETFPNKKIAFDYSKESKKEYGRSSYSRMKTIIFYIFEQEVHPYTEQELLDLIKDAFLTKPYCDEKYRQEIGEVWAYREGRKILGWGKGKLLLENIGSDRNDPHMPQWDDYDDKNEYLDHLREWFKSLSNDKQKRLIFDSYLYLSFDEDCPLYKTLQKNSMLPRVEGFLSEREDFTNVNEDFTGDIMHETNFGAGNYIMKMSLPNLSTCLIKPSSNAAITDTGDDKIEDLRQKNGQRFWALSVGSERFTYYAYGAYDGNEWPKKETLNRIMDKLGGDKFTMYYARGQKRIFSSYNSMVNWFKKQGDEGIASEQECINSALDHSYYTK